MRLTLSALTLALGGPSAAALITHTAGFAHAVASVAAVLPSPAAAALMFAGLGLVAGAQRGRSQALAD